MQGVPHQRATEGGVIHIQGAENLLTEWLLKVRRNFASIFMKLRFKNIYLRLRNEHAKILRSLDGSTVSCRVPSFLGAIHYLLLNYLNIRLDTLTQSL